MNVIDMLAPARAGEVRTATLTAAAPWGIQRAPVPSMAFHVVMQGDGWLRMPGAQPLRLASGDFVLLPNGAGHALSSHPQGPVVLDTDLLGGRVEAPRIDLPGQGPRMRSLCAGYPPGNALPAQARALLPPVLHVPARQLAGLSDALRMLMAETSQDQPGSRTVVDRLADILCVQAVRLWLPSDEMGDLAVATTVHAMREDLARPWTLEELAGRAGLSRASLTRRFARVMGEPPLSHLRRLRMELAARRLRESGEPLAAIARDIGYTSEFAFSRAFSRTFGVAPGRYRTQAPPP
ncbi:AraC family transcriptional regulator [Nonomuraea sp. NPDC046802]|uniref:AraC family transcriptional regulator n=1 Tax=Nonomuraea sp. NPDC046802 TaxID=3154919 RepID=UPI0033D500D1